MTKVLDMKMDVITDELGVNLIALGIVEMTAEKVRKVFRLNTCRLSHLSFFLSFFLRTLCLIGKEVHLNS